MMGCYLLHFERRLHHAGHYLGFAEDIEARIRRHRVGQGDRGKRRAPRDPVGRLPAVMRDKGIGFKLVRTWPGADRAMERRLKNQKQGPRICPVCRAMGRPE